MPNKVIFFEINFEKIANVISFFLTSKPIEAKEICDATTIRTATSACIYGNYLENIRNLIF